MNRIHAASSPVAPFCIICDDYPGCAARLFSKNICVYIHNVALGKRCKIVNK
jgi:hypothetical protein